MLVLTPLPKNFRPTNTKQINQGQVPSASTVQAAPTRKVGTIKPICVESDLHLAIGTYYYIFLEKISVPNPSK
jgi:hypothetical protein